ncbi:MAG: NTP transferase domain-containing protein, partial [Halobaculum sp.]
MDHLDALVMCGGRGTRLDTAREKPMVRVGGRPMVARVLDAVHESRTERTVAVGSPHTPATRAYVEEPPADAPVAVHSADYLEAPGEGYVADLAYALDRVDPPVVTVAADLPLLAGEVIDRLLGAADGESLTLCVPAALVRQLGATVDTSFSVDGRELVPTGLNVVGASDTDGDDDGSGGRDSDTDTGSGDADDGSDRETNTNLTYDARAAVNVNRQTDVQVAAALL